MLILFENAPEKLYPFTIVIRVFFYALLYSHLKFLSLSCRVIRFVFLILFDFSTKFPLYIFQMLVNLLRWNLIYFSISSLFLSLSLSLDSIRNWLRLGEMLVKFIDLLFSWWKKKPSSIEETQARAIGIHKWKAWRFRIFKFSERAYFV